MIGSARMSVRTGPAAFGLGRLPELTHTEKLTAERIEFASAVFFWAASAYTDRRNKAERHRSMAYRFTLGDAGVEAALRRISGEQLDGALASLATAEQDLERSIHGVRTSTKRIRALLRLLRAVFPDYGDANAALRALARRLADVREAQVLIAMFDGIASTTKASKSTTAFRAELEAEEQAAIARVQGAILKDTHAELTALRDEVETWGLERDGFGALRKGLKKTCRMSVKLIAEAAEGDTEAFHEWRKHVKDHSFQVRLLHDMDPTLGARGEMLARLGNVLGEQHDLCALEDRLKGRKEKALRRLEKAATEQRRGLEKEALMLGGVLFEEPCKSRLQRWERAWVDWRDDA